MLRYGFCALLQFMLGRHCTLVTGRPIHMRVTCMLVYTADNTDNNGINAVLTFANHIRRRAPAPPTQR